MKNSYLPQQQSEQTVTLLLEEDVKSRLKKISPDIEYVILDENYIIDGFAKKLNSLYKTIYSDIEYMNMHDKSISESSCHKLIIYKHGLLEHILLFKYDGKARHIIILNHYFQMCIQDIETVRDIIFCDYKNVKKITFPYLYLEKVEKKSLMILYEQLNDWVVELPESMDLYMKSLSNKTRTNIRSYQKRIVKDYPDFKVSFYEGEDISLDQITRLVELHKGRMKTKEKKSDIDTAVCESLYQYARIRGVLCLCNINENIIGGTLDWIFDDHVYGRLISHDNAYNNHHVGYIALTNSIQYMIEKNMKFHHFGFGDIDYKRRFLAVAHAIHDVIVFKNHMIFFLNSINYTIRSLIKATKKHLENNEKLKRIYRKIRKLLNK